MYLSPLLKWEQNLGNKEISQNHLRQKGYKFIVSHIILLINDSSTPAIVKQSIFTVAKPEKLYKELKRSKLAKNEYLNR